MQVYRLFFRILNKHKGMMIMYIAIFMSIAFITSSQMKKNNETGYVNKACDFAAFDYDQSDCSRGLVEMLDLDNKQHTLDQDKIEIIQDQLYDRDVDCVVRIKEGFAKHLQEENASDYLDVVAIKDTATASAIETQIDSYLKLIDSYLTAGYEEKEACRLAAAAYEQKAQVTLIDQDASGQRSGLYYYFIYCAYVFIAMTIVGIGPILLLFNQKEVRARINCSAYHFSSLNRELLLGVLTVGLGICALFFAGSFVMGKASLSAKGMLYLLNSLCIMSVSLAITFIVGQTIKKLNAINMVANVVSLGCSFLCGIFVPMELLGEGVLKVAHFLPAYWYAVACEKIDRYEQLADLQEISQDMGVQLLFTIALICIGLVIAKTKKSPGN